MKCITICQPYADLILLPDSDENAKRVENRVWPVTYRGPLLIHAGKSLSWLGCSKEEAKELYPDMVFGAIIGVSLLVDCVHIDRIRNGQMSKSYPWLRGHKHASGPYCWILEECRRFAEPIPYRGEKGLFEVPENLISARV